MISTTRVQVLSSAVNKNIDKDLLPLLGWLRLIGIIAPPSREICVSWLGYIYRSIIWLFSTAVNGVIFYDALYPYFMFKDSNAVVFTWVEIIKCATKAIHSVVIHTTMFLFFNRHWNQLNESFIQTENCVGSYKIENSKLWKLCCVGVTYIIFIVSIIQDLISLKKNVYNRWLFRTAT